MDSSAGSRRAGGAAANRRSVGPSARPDERTLLKNQLRRLLRIEGQLSSAACGTCGAGLDGAVNVRITAGVLGPPEPPCHECDYPLRITVNLFEEPS